MAIQYQLPSEIAAVAAVIDPQSLSSNGTATTAWVDFSSLGAGMAVFFAGATVTASFSGVEVEQATDSSGTGAKSLRSASSMATASKQSIVQFLASELDSGYTHARMSVDHFAALGRNDFAGLLLGFYGRYGPATVYNAASVQEIVE